MNVFELEDYKKIVRQALVEKKKIAGTQFSFQNLAAACGIEKAFLSRVLNGKSHLSANQLLLACEFLEFKKPERDYLLQVWLMQRATNRKQREALLLEVRRLQQAMRRTEESVEVNPLQVSTQKHVEYFLEPNAQLVHMFVAIDAYRTQIRTIAEKLSMSTQELERILSLLMSLGAIEVKKGQLSVASTEYHLPSGSPVFKAYRNNLRVKALAKMSGLENEKAYSFSAVFCATDKVKQKLQSEFLEYLSRSRKLIGDAPSEHVYQLNFDLFQWD